MSEPLAQHDWEEYVRLCSYLDTSAYVFDAFKGQLVTECTDKAVKAQCRALIAEAVDHGIIRQDRWRLDVEWSATGPARVLITPVLLLTSRDVDISLVVSTKEQDHE